MTIKYICKDEDRHVEYVVCNDNATWMEAMYHYIHFLSSVGYTIPEDVKEELFNITGDDFIV